MITLFYELKKDKNFNHDIDPIIEVYCKEYLEMNKNYDFYYDEYSTIQNLNIEKSLNEELKEYETTKPDNYSFESKNDIKTLFMKSCLLESLKKVIEIKNKLEKESQKKSRKYKRIHNYHFYPDINEYSNYDQFYHALLK